MDLNNKSKNDNDVVFETSESTPTKKKKKDPRGCAIGCLSVIAIFLLVLFISYSCSGGGNSKEKEWIDQLKSEKQQAEELYVSNAPVEEQVELARSKAQELQAQYDTIREETDKSQLDYPLLRAYVCVKEMYTSLSYMKQNIDYEQNSNTYFQANNEAAQILQDNYSD